MNAPRFGERRYRTRLGHYSGWPALTALVDILFLALVFFAMAGSFARVSGIAIALPSVNTRSAAALERFVISLAPAAPGAPEKMHIFFREKRCRNLDELRELLSELPGRSRVIIRADRNLAYEEVVKVMEAAKSAGVPSCFIAVEVPKEKPVAAYE